MKKITYSEPTDFFPKEIRDKYFPKGKKKPTTPTKDKPKAEKGKK